MTNPNQAMLDRVEKEQVRFIDLQFVDLLGTVKSVTIPAHRFRHVQEHREWFDGSSVEGFARVSESDMYLRPDPSTFAVIPWEVDGERTARVISDVYTPRGEPFPGDPRLILRKEMEKAAEAGFVYNVGPEMEFFLFRTPIDGIAAPSPQDRAGYFDVSADQGQQVRKEIVNVLEAMGIEVETSHHEVAIGQHEIDFHYLPGLEAADAGITLKWAVRAVAQRHDLHASFMPKPLFGVAGSGMHVHQSLIGEDGVNLFSDPEDPYGLSMVARHFIAGQLAHARGMTAVLAPLVNSYKRLVTGYEAPVYISWGRMNRSALIRVPETSPGDFGATRIELRLADPSCNPYLAFAVMLRAGMDGIEQELPLPEPVEENLFTFDPARRSKFSVGILPKSLSEALDDLEQDSLVCDTLGPHLLDRFVEAKRMEWEEYRVQVTPWELERYLPIH